MPRRKRSVLLREELHRLVDELPEADLYSAKRFMAYLRNTQSPWLQKLLDAPYDDEPLTDAIRRRSRRLTQTGLPGEYPVWSK